MWLLELSQSSWSRDTISVSDKHKLSGNKGGWEERNRMMKLCICSSAHSLVKPGSVLELPVMRGPRQKGVSGCDSSLVTAPRARETGLVCWAGICTFISQFLLDGSFQQGEGLNAFCPSDYPIPKLFIK